MEDKDKASPTVQRRRLRLELRRARLDLGLTQEHAAEAMEWSLSKLVRIENGTNNISTNDLKVVLQYYRITDERRVAELLGLSRAARARSAWSEYSTVAPKRLIELIEYENAAHTSRNFEPLVVPGLLQTGDYIRASTRQLDPERPERLESVVELRRKRQELLGRADAPLLFFVVDEAVVRRVVGGKDVMRGQLQRMIDIAELPGVTIEVVPFSAGLWPGMQEPFVILEFADIPDDYVLYVENPRGDLLPDEMSAIYLKAFDRLRESSLGPQGTIAFLRELADELG